VNGLASDPRFVNYQADGSGDYHLQSNSPARNAGFKSKCSPFDFDGASRSQGAELDIGAYEFVAVSPPTALNAVVR